MLFFFLSFIQPISLQRHNDKSYSKKLITYSNIVDFSQFRPEIAIRIVLYGFNDDNSFQKSFENILERFLSSKKFGVPSSSTTDNSYINVSLTFSVHSNKVSDKFYEDYLNLISKAGKSDDINNYIHVAQDSEFTSIFSNLHAKEILKSSKAHGKQSAEKYTLILVNHSLPVQFQYENSNELTTCLVFEFNSGFCHISPVIDDNDIEFINQRNNNYDQPKGPVNDKNFYLTKLFKYTSIFVDEIIIPDLLDYQNKNFLVTPSKIIAPIVTFGPKIKSLATLQKEVTNLFSPIESLLIVNRQNLYEFPLVATALQSNIGSSLLFTALAQSQHIFGSSLGTAIINNDENYRRWKEKLEKEDTNKKKKNDYLNFTETVSSVNRRKVTPIYVLNSRDDNLHYLHLNLVNNNFFYADSNVDNNYVSAIFANDTKEVENVILASIAKMAGNINFLKTQFPREPSYLFSTSSEVKRLKKHESRYYCTFGGHHPFYPCGASRSFSPIFTDAIIRNFALSNILVSFRNFIETQNKMKKLSAMGLNFLNSSLNSDNLKTLQKMIVRTSERINNNEIAKALSSSTKAAEISIKILNEADELLLESTVFGNCCPETVYVSRSINSLIVAFIVISFFGVVAYAFYKLYLLYKKKKITPRAFL